MRLTFLLILFLITFRLWSQQTLHSSVVGDERLSYVGMTLDAMIERFGTPKTVAAARGNELWQDDVVFQYTHGDFYIYKDRVWQVRYTSAFGISARDRKAAALLVLGNTVVDNEDHALLSISGKDWPLILRVNFNDSGLVTEIYVYRPDY